MVVYKKRQRIPLSLNPNQMLYDLGLGAVEGVGKLAVRAVRGIVSAFQSRGASKQEIKQLVAPLAQSLTYTSRRPTFAKAEGGLSIEHIENLGVFSAGHSAYSIDSNLFTWLAGIANQFEEYQIQLWFAWNPICPATTTGQVLMAFDYDPIDVGDGRYIDAADYFNTADHCVSAIWAPAAIAPTKSAWLKTGNAGDARLVSPGLFHINVTDPTAGYLTVKYQVALRKPQPSNNTSSASFSGSYTTATGLFASPGVVVGNASLIQWTSSSVLTIKATPGYKIVVWSSDATAASVSATLGSADLMGTRSGTGIAIVARVNPNTAAAFGGTVSAPGGATSYKVEVYQELYNPLYF